mgnify:CR=1 FL=1
MDGLVLGIDPGTATTGYALVLETAGGLHLEDCGVITTSADCPLPKRLQQIYRELLGLARRCQPAAAAVEELFFSRNARTALAVGQARGVVLLAMAEAGLPVYEYTPLQVKQAIAGYGRATKGQMQQMVRMLLSLEVIPQPDDAADAAAVAICHIHSARMKTLVEG